MCARKMRGTRKRRLWVNCIGCGQLTKNAYTSYAHGYRTRLAGFCFRCRTQKQLKRGVLKNVGYR